MGRKALVDDFDDKKLGVNPFIKDLVILVTDVSEDKVLHETKDVTDHMVVNVSEYRTFSFTLEKQVYVKYFRNTEFRKLIASRKGNTNKLFLWIQGEVKSGRDYLTININRCKLECCFNHNTYRSSVQDLIEIGVLANTKHRNVFWINPKMFYCGSRIKKYSDNVIKV